MPTPKISVFIPCYNYANYVAQAMESVLAQTDPDLELIVVDNGSTDNSWEVIQSIQDPRVRTFQIETNDGIGPAWVLGLAHCRGEWFSFLSADDFLLPRKHELLLEYLAAHPEVDAVGAYISQVDENGQRWQEFPWMEHIINETRDYNLLEAWMMRHYLCMPAALYRRSLCVVPTDGANSVIDYSFHLDLLRRGCRFAQVQEQVACYRWHSANTTGGQRSTVALQFAYVYAMRLLPYLHMSGQQAMAAEAIKRFFDLYDGLLKTTSRHDLGCVMLCMLWPEWVAQNCTDYPSVAAVEWETRQDEYPFLALHALVNESFYKWMQPQPAATTPQP